MFNYNEAGNRLLRGLINIGEQSSPASVSDASDIVVMWTTVYVVMPPSVKMLLPSKRVEITLPL